MKYSGGLKTERFWILDGPMWSVYSSNHSKTEQIRWPQFCSVFKWSGLFKTLTGLDWFRDV